MASGDEGPDIVVWLDGLDCETIIENFKAINVLVIADEELDGEVGVRCIYTRFVKQKLEWARHTHVGSQKRLNHSNRNMLISSPGVIGKRIVQQPHSDEALPSRPQAQLARLEDVVLA